jgi:hypothetical protein
MERNSAIECVAGATSALKGYAVRKSRLTTRNMIFSGDFFGGTASYLDSVIIEISKNEENIVCEMDENRGNENV